MAPVERRVTATIYPSVYPVDVGYQSTIYVEQWPHVTEHHSVFTMDVDTAVRCFQWWAIQRDIDWSEVNLSVVHRSTESTR